MKKSFTILSVPAFILLFTGALIASGGGGGNMDSRSPNTSSGLTSLGNNNGPQISPLALIYHDDLDGANDTTALKARGYKIYYRGTGPQGTAAIWFQGNGTIFPAYSGPPDGYVGSNYNSVTNVNTINNWLVLPALSISSGDTFSFYSQSPLNSTFPDSIRVMYSAVGDSIPEAASWVELGRFKVNTLGMWELKEFIANATGSGARFAIQYHVAGGGPGGSASDYIGIDDIMVRGAAPVVCPVATVPITTSGSNCGAGTVALSATTGGTNTYVVWMDSLGNVVSSGNNFNPSLSATTTFYAADADTVGVSANVGPDTSIATGLFPTANFTNGLFFTAMTDLRIDSIHLYSNGAVSGNFQISDTAGGAIQQTAPFSLPGAGYHQVYVGLNISAGDYFINMGSFTGTGVLFRTTGGATYPYTVPGLVSITGANFPTAPTRYYYFFDWTVTPVCFGTQVATTAAILPANNTLPFFEDFENGLPCNWSTSQAPGSTGWLWGDSASLSSQFWVIPGHTNFMASNDDTCNCDMSMDYLISPVFDFSSYTSLTNITLNFEAYYDSLYGSSAYVEVSLDSGLTWNIVHTLSPAATWQNVIVDLSAYAGNPAVQIAFHHDDNLNWADGFAVDDVLITAQCSGEELTVNLLTDIYGTEISWSIVDVNTGTVYGSAGPFDDINPYNITAATHNMTVCVPLGATLEWRIEDSFGDGLTDGTNTGNYSLIGPCGQLITSGSGAFTSGGSTANPPQYDSLVFTVQPPAINLGADTIMCEGTTLMLDAGLPNVTWSTGQTTQSIVVNNNIPGTYEYYVSTPAGNCYATDTITVTVNPLPVPNFTATSVLGLATFTNTTANGVTYHWSFGTGNAADTSNLENPTFTYTANGTYTVVLTASNPCGSVSHTFDITITGIVGITEIPGSMINISPNPATNFMNIDISGLSGEKVTVSITNVLGQQIYSDVLSLTGDNYSKKINVSSYDKGVYFIIIQTEKHATTRKLILE